MRKFISIGIVLAVASIGATATAGELQLRNDVTFLVDERTAGRMTGSEGARLAADYLEKQLEAIGASALPGLDGFVQPFEFTAGMEDGGSTIRLTAGDSSREWSGRGLRIRRGPS